MWYEGKNGKEEVIEKMKEIFFNQNIKIRVWHPDLMEMFYFDTIKDIIDWRDLDCYRNDDNKDEDKCVTYMQYLGKDNYEKDIYQGDIIKITFEKDGEKFEFTDIAATFSIYFVKEDNIMFEKIGNIYENPELFN